MTAKKKNISTNGNNLIREWDEWESLPEPDADKNVVLKKDFKAECQELITELKKSKKELSKDQYFKILSFQANITLYLDIIEVDLPELILKLHELRIACIMKVNSFKITTILDSLSTFISKIEKKSPQTSPSRRFNTQSKIRETPKREAVQSTTNNHKSNANEKKDNEDNVFHFNDSISSFNSSKKPTSPFSNYLNTNKYKAVENPFQSLASNENTYENESAGISPANSSFEMGFSRPRSVELSDDFKAILYDFCDLLYVNNGITDSRYAHKIYEKIYQIHQLIPKDSQWTKEYEYFKNREMIPLQHIVQLRQLLSNYI